jgi:hypothetical protein
MCALEPGDTKLHCDLESTVFVKNILINSSFLHWQNLHYFLWWEFAWPLWHTFANVLIAYKICVTDVLWIFLVKWMFLEVPIFFLFIIVELCLYRQPIFDKKTHVFTTSINISIMCVQLGVPVTAHSISAITFRSSPFWSLHWFFEMEQGWKLSSHLFTFVRSVRLYVV